MRTRIDAFTRAATSLMTEIGPLDKRPSWADARTIAADLISATDTVISQLNSECALLFILAAYPTGAMRDACLKLFFQQALVDLPSPAMLTLLSQLSAAELKDNLLPFIYENGNRGAVTGYIAACQKVFVAPEVFQYFLSTRSWTKTDLMNLSFIARPEDVGAICSQLDTAATNYDSPAIRETFAEFRYILFNHTNGEPLLPDLLPVEAILNTALPKITTAPTAPSPLTAKRTGPAVATTSEPVPRPAVPLTTYVVKPSPATRQSLIVPISAILLLLSVAMIFSSWYYSEPLYQPQADKTTGKAPQFWVDAVSQRPITAKFLSADKDYRMGELYLTRDMYAEALKLFEDAIYIDSGHLQALFRSGYCRMHLGDRKSAIKIFQKILNQQPLFESINLYLARIALAGNDVKSAEKHFQAEYAIKKDLNVGMEYANFLAKQGNQNAAMELISTLQERFPDKMLVLSQDSVANINKSQEGSHNE